VRMAVDMNAARASSDSGTLILGIVWFSFVSLVLVEHLQSRNPPPAAHAPPRRRVGNRRVKSLERLFICQNPPRFRKLFLLLAAKKHKAAQR
jgi:hypothetical protein